MRTTDFGGSRNARSIFLVVLDGPSHVSYTLIIHYMVIFLTVFEILDIIHDEILPSGAILGVPEPQVKFVGCTRWAMSCFLYIDNTLYGDIPYRF